LISSLENQTIALCGLFLATELVQSIADSGQFNDSNMRIALDSIFTLDADTVESVYGTKLNLRSGQQRLIDQLGGSSGGGSGTPNLQITHYTLNLLKLENKCNSQPQVLERIRVGIENTEKLRNHFDTLDEEVISSLAKIYTDNISTLSPRIVVHGNREYLEDTNKANAIRACLLAGIRSAVLWRQ